MVRKRGSLGYFYAVFMLIHPHFIRVFPSPVASCQPSRWWVVWDRSSLLLIVTLPRRIGLNFMGFINWGFFCNTNLWFWVMVYWLTHFAPLHCLIRQSVRLWVMQTHHIHVGKGSCCTVALKWPLGWVAKQVSSYMAGSSDRYQLQSIAVVTSPGL